MFRLEVLHVDQVLRHLCLFALVFWGAVSIGQVRAGTVYAAHEIRFKRFLVGEADTDIGNINALNSIVQDHQGYIWFGGEDGLARYNGVDFTFYKKDLAFDHSISSSYIWDLTVDRNGVVWIATAQGLNRFDPNSNGFVYHSSTQLGPNIQAGKGLGVDVIYSLAVGPDNSLYVGTSDGLFVLNPDRSAFERVKDLKRYTIRSLLVDPENNLWVGTTDKGLYQISSSREVKHWQEVAGDPRSLPQNYVRALEMDKHGDLWIGTFGGGVARLDQSRAGFERFVHDPENPHSLSSNSIWDIHEDRHGNLWFATDPGGLAQFDRDKHSFVRHVNNPFQLQSLNSDKVRAVYDDHMGDLWVGTFPSGVNYFNKSTARFRNFTANPKQANSLSHASVVRFFADSEEDVWIGTEGGLNKFDPNTEAFTHYIAEPGRMGALQANAVLAITEDHQGGLWVGTWSGGLHRFDKQSQQFTHYGTRYKDERYIADDYIWGLLYDSQERLWVGTENAGLQMRGPNDKGFRQFNADPDDPDSLSFRHVWALLEDSNKRIWIGTIDGLDLLESIDGEGARFEHYRHDPQDERTLSSNRIISLFEDHRGSLWVGTQDAGLNRLDVHSGKVDRFSIENGLPSNHISSIVEDDQGFIWVSTVNGIAMLNPNTNEVNLYSESNGLVSSHFNRDASYKDRQGRLYFGGANGFSVFEPTTFNTPKSVPQIVIHDFRILNQSIFPSTLNSPLEKPIALTDFIELSSEHVMFEFDFFAVNYRAPHRNQYAYMLDGFDLQWNEVGNKHTATYTNLDPGQYVFRVRAANADGIWNLDGPAITLSVHGPFWSSKLAYFMYLCSLVGVVVFFYNLHRNKLKYQNQKLISDKLIKLDRIKDAFLANTSHELRTPLNGIIGLAESLYDGSKGELNDDVKSTLHIISSCGRRLSSLINDILDYSKLTEQQLKLRTGPTQLHQLVATVFNLLSPLIGAKSISLINNVPHSLYVDADEDRLHQILLNLTGNAIKFSDKGEIKIYTKMKGKDKVDICVQDSGPGISHSDIDKIFSAFIQLDDDEAREQGGTGLGLAITKQLVELHGSNIKVNSVVDEGSTFKFTLNVCAKPSAEEEKQKEQQPLGTANEIEKERLSKLIPSDNPDVVTLLKPADGNEVYTILVVDDDSVNRMVLTSILSIQNYRVIEACSGEDALDALESNPEIDLIILDVMMPKMTGYEVCMRIRVNRLVQDLPILFLTAKNYSDDLVRGFIAGGSDFLTKPVSKHELLSRVSTHLSLLNIHRSLEEKYQKVCAEKDHNDQELKALEHIVDIINREIDFELILKHLLQEVKTLLDADEIIYWQAEPNGESQYAVISNDEEGLNEVCLHNGREITQKLEALHHDGQSILILEKYSQSDFNFVEETFPGSVSSVLMTIYFQGSVVGFITILSYQPNKRFSNESVATLGRIHAHVTSAVIKAKLLHELELNHFIDSPKGLSDADE